uniref:uncharacterized protein LOC120340595 isoform X2 n=1 Tax=Styela clava TaxID=7725 RepID=UPI001939ADFE|nr:uncharacterized protein LOC120340595 isoform X2 [Styela clava]
MTAKCACNCAMPSDSKSMKYCPMTMDWKIHLLQFPLLRNHTLCHFKHLNVSMPKTEIKPCYKLRHLQLSTDYSVDSDIMELMKFIVDSLSDYILIQNTFKDEKMAQELMKEKKTPKYKC